MTDVSMQRILLDTNVLLDYLLHRDDHAKMAEAVMELGTKNNVTLLCASLSLKDIAYLSSSAIRREFKPNESEVENFTRGFLSSRVPWRCIEQVKEMVTSSLSMSRHVIGLFPCKNGIGILKMI